MIIDTPNSHRRFANVIIGTPIKHPRFANVIIGTPINHRLQRDDRADDQQGFDLVGAA